MGELNNVCKQKKNEQNWSEGGEEWSGFVFVFVFVWGNCASFRGLFCNIMFFLILSMEQFFLKIILDILLKLYFENMISKCLSSLQICVLNPQ